MKISNNKIGVFHIITCPICGFTFRMVDLKTRHRNKICPLCGCELFRVDFNKFIFIDSVSF